MFLGLHPLTSSFRLLGRMQKFKLMVWWEVLSPYHCAEGRRGKLILWCTQLCTVPHWGCCLKKARLLWGSGGSCAFWFAKIKYFVYEGTQSTIPLLLPRPALVTCPRKSRQVLTAGVFRFPRASSLSTNTHRSLIHLREPSPPLTMNSSDHCWPNVMG